MSSSRVASRGPTMSATCQAGHRHRQDRRRRVRYVLFRVLVARPSVCRPETEQRGLDGSVGAPFSTTRRRSLSCQQSSAAGRLMAWSAVRPERLDYRARRSGAIASWSSARANVRQHCQLAVRCHPPYAQLSPTTPRDTPAARSDFRPLCSWSMPDKRQPERRPSREDVQKGGKQPRNAPPPSKVQKEPPGPPPGSGKSDKG